MKPPKRLCFFGIYRPDYPRNDVLLAACRAAGIEAVECREEEKAPGRYGRLARRLARSAGSYDVILAAYPAAVPAMIAKALTIFSRKKLIVDAFYSMYDAAVNDRRQFSRFHPMALKMLAYDWLSVLVADLVLVDTEEHKKYWSTWLFVRPEKIRVIPLGVNPARIYPIARSAASLPPHATATFHGTYIPHQGIGKTVRAFDLLKDDKRLSFRLIGDGQEFPRITALIKELGLEKRIDVVARIPYTRLNEYLSATDLSIGIFGDSRKAKRAVPNKIFEACAAGVAVITADTPAMREMYRDDEVRLVTPEPAAIAAAIRELANDKAGREALAARGRRKTLDCYAPPAIGALLAGCLDELA